MSPDDSKRKTRVTRFFNLRGEVTWQVIWEGDDVSKLTAEYPRLSDPTRDELGHIKYEDISIEHRFEAVIDGKLVEIDDPRMAA